MREQQFSEQTCEYNEEADEVVTVQQVWDQDLESHSCAEKTTSSIFDNRKEKGRKKEMEAAK